MSAERNSRGEVSPRLAALQKALKKVPTFADALQQMHHPEAKVSTSAQSKNPQPSVIGVPQTLKPTVDSDPEKARVKAAMNRLGMAPKTGKQAPVKPMGDAGQLSGTTAPTLQKAYEPKPSDIDRFRKLHTAAQQLADFHGRMDPSYHDYNNIGRGLEYVQEHLGRARSVMESSGPSLADRIRTKFSTKYKSVEDAHMDRAHSWLHEVHRRVGSHPTYRNPDTRPKIDLEAYQKPTRARRDTEKP